MNYASPDESGADYRGWAETSQLEFKRALWTGGDECAKDVAALANATGGVIIVGVVCGDDGRATGYVNWRNSASQEEVERRLIQFMEHSLRPRDFVDAVRFSVACVRDGHEVLVVSVPPSPSLVAVAAQDTRDRRATRFAAPIRVGAETRYMEFDEMVKRSADMYRGTRLQLEELLAEEGGAAARYASGEPHVFAALLIREDPGRPRRWPPWVLMRTVDARGMPASSPLRKWLAGGQSAA